LKIKGVKGYYRKFVSPGRIFLGVQPTIFVYEIKGDKGSSKKNVFLGEDIGEPIKHNHRGDILILNQSSHESSHKHKKGDEYYSEKLGRSI